MRTSTRVSLAVLALTAASRAEITLYELTGPTSQSNFGVSSERIADMNGDGIDELAISAPCASLAGTCFGAVFIHSGRDGSLLRTINGTRGAAAFGFALEPAGDVNGDGLEDLVVGAPLWDEFGAGSGAAFVYSGLDGSLIHAFKGTSYGENVGFEVAGPGDLDGDGYDDVLVGAPGFYHPDSPGYARAYSGRTGAPLYTLLPDRVAGWLGYSIAALGDLDRDGRPDFAVGAPIDDLYAHEAGMVRVYSGRNATPLFTWRGGAEEDYFGRSLTDAGDVNGDSFDDVLIGAPAEGSTPWAELRSGKDGALLATLVEGAGRDDNFGFGVVGLGDLNGDRVPDFGIGGDTRVQVFSGRDLTVLQDLPGGPYAGVLAGAGDVDGDGFGDVLVCNPTHLANRGRARMIAGTPCGLARAEVYGSGWPGTLGVPAIGLGRSTFDDSLPSLGHTFTVAFDNSRGAATNATLLAGFRQDRVPTPWGGTLLLVPRSRLQVQAGSTRFIASLSVPSNAALCGLEVFLQGFVADPGASRGIAFTPGLKLVLGN